MSVFVVTSQCDYDYPNIEGVWQSREEAESWVKMMCDSWDRVDDYHTDYYIKEYTVK